MVSAVITSSIICTKPSTSVASVDVAAVPVVSCDTTLCKLVTAASVTTWLAIVAKCWYAPTVAACCPAANWLAAPTKYASAFVTEPVLPPYSTS